MKRFILFAILVLIALSPLAYTQEIGGVYGVFSPAKIGAKKLPSWLSSEYSPIFNGVNAYAYTTGNIDRPVATGPITVMLWLKYFSSSTPYSSHFRFNDSSISFYGGASYGVFRSFNNGYYTVAHNNGIWTHYAISLPQNSPMGSASVYVDGIKHVGSEFGAATSTPISIISQPVYLGKNDVHFGNDSLSEISIWNRALSQSEILKYKDKRLKGTESGLTNLWHMNDNSSTLVDSVGSKNAIATNTVWTKRNGFQPPDVRSERWALSFDGVDDYATAPCSISTYPFTLSGWFSCPPVTLNLYAMEIGFGIRPTGPEMVDLYIQNTGGINYMRFRISGTILPYAFTSAPIVGSWMHFCAVGASATDRKLYINGTCVASASTLVPFPTSANAKSFVIGGWSGSMEVQKGKFADVALFDRALTDSEIRSIVYSPPTSVSPPPVQYYKLNEGTGSTLANLGSAGSAANATLYNSPTWVGRDIPLNKQEIYGISDIRSENYALSFDGVDDIASAPATGLPSGSSSRTIMAWIYDTDPTSSNFRIPISYGTGGSGRSLALCLGGNPGNNNEVGIGIGGQTFTFPYTRSLGWSHYAVTLPNNGTLGSFSVYINGANQTQTKTYITATANTPVDTNLLNAHINLGTYISASVYACKCKLAEVSVWNRVLSDSEIQQSMYAKLTGNETGLVRYYKLNEGFGTTLDDVASGGYNMTLLNSPTWVERDIP